MRSRFRTSSVVAITILMGAVPVFSHHGNSDYDLKTQITLSGTVADFFFINPHSILRFTVQNDQGKSEEWQGELQSPNMLARKGHWTKDTVKPGDRITIFGCPAKNGSKSLMVKKIQVGDGEEFPGM